MPAIGLNLVTIRNGLDVKLLTENLGRVKKAGFDGVGIWVDTIENWVGSGRTVAEMARILRDNGLAVHELCFVPVLDDKGEVADRRRAFEWAAELNCPAVISIYFRPSDPLEVVQAKWAAFVDKVKDIGVSPTFEFIGPWVTLNSPLSAWQVVGAGPDIGGIVLDVFHFWRGGGDLSELDRVPCKRIRLVHLNDVNNVPRESAQDSDRTYPGEGIIPVADILRKLMANGFTGPLSVEIFGKVQEEDPDVVAPRACQAAKKLVASL